ncbi:adenylate kinase family enzyme [Clostridium punense]|uniref:Adenylate kinase family enzyme n=1 Tax=Clostridium punense TaxID=1054297 RepID=A0ABS4K7Y0_9CLOT|nr:restriction endonuclease [Clostridium punense]MBP2023909.1 adenylate kinase family enzyme [Clostridium punense]
MYNFENLNDYEFEILCKDIMEKKLNAELRVYKQGKDGGIDINAFTGNEIIIQVKHYVKSSYNSLKTSLISELKKVKKLNPNQYYICTSQKLSVQNVNEIYELFKNFMNSSKNIIDGTQINEFLKEENNIDIVKRNYKLWLTSTNVLEIIYNKNIFIDSDELVYDIEKDSKFYVETESYTNAKKILNNNKVIIIQGDPGVGKSTLSKMLILNYISEGYSVRYSTDNDISNIKKALSHDIEKKEIILLDDFLGQHYLKLRDNQPNEIKSLISFVRRYNKKLILNTRITILNEAKRLNLHFKNLLDDGSIEQYVIDLNTMKREEKAKILYNHIYFNNLPKEYFDEIKVNKRYLKVIAHKNYNPRIIQYVTRERSYKNISYNEYFQYIMSKLENPQDVWEDEFVNRIEKIDREFMNTLYSLTNNYIENNILEECFNKRIDGVNKSDSTLNSYEIGVKRLSDALIKIVYDNGIARIGVLNPSINDYISAQLNKNNNEILNIINNAVYIEQVLKFSHIGFVDKWIKEKLVNGSILNLKTQGIPIEYYFLKYIIEFKILNKNLENDIKQSIVRLTDEFYRGYSDLVINIFDVRFIEFYNLYSLIIDIDKMNAIIDKMELEDVTIFLVYINDILKKSQYHSEKLIDDFNYMAQEILNEKIIDEVKNNFDDNLDEYVGDIVDGAPDNYANKYYEGNKAHMESYVKISLTDYFNDFYDEVIDNVNEIYKVLIDKIDAINFIEELSYEDSIESYLFREPDYDDDDYTNRNSHVEDVVEYIFERSYS